MADRLELALRSYEAYETGDRNVVEELLTDDFVFFSPADVGIDRAAYFERCWPNSENRGLRLRAARRVWRRGDRHL